MLDDEGRLFTLSLIAIYEDDIPQIPLIVLLKKNIHHRAN